MDSRHWSQRWMRWAQVGNDAVVMYDLHAAVEIKGCGLGRCSNLNNFASPAGHRYRVMRFWDIETCQHCGRPFGYARIDQTLYLGDSLEEAAGIFTVAEATFFGYQPEEEAG
jgi:hypothetical protein